VRLARPTSLKCGTASPPPLQRSCLALPPLKPPVLALGARRCSPPYTAGSSREFRGWQAAPDSAIMVAIMERAHSFMPALSPALLQAALNGGGGPAAASVRVGLRPYAVGGLPAIGPVQGLPGVLVAAGHEGSGLSLAPATAELVLQQLGAARGGGAPLAGGVAIEMMPEQRLAAAAEACLLTRR
jgi:glycine/D-amino acid oxidase-like deaminating enzyme